MLRARAEIGANLYASAFVPDLPRMRRLEDALDALPAEEQPPSGDPCWDVSPSSARADVDATDRVRAWADEAVAVARSTGDPVLVAQTLLDQSMAPTSPAEIDAGLVAADEVVRLAEQAGRPDLAVYGHQRRAGYHLNRGDLGAAGHSLGRAEVLAALLPSPVVAPHHARPTHDAAGAERQPRRPRPPRWRRRCASAPATSSRWW